MRLFFDEDVYPHCATLTCMILHVLLIDGIGTARLLPVLGLPKKTITEYMAEKWYDMYTTFNALKGVCNSSGDQVLLDNQILLMKY